MSDSDARALAEALIRDSGEHAVSLDDHVSRLQAAEARTQVTFARLLTAFAELGANLQTKFAGLETKFAEQQVETAKSHRNLAIALFGAQIVLLVAMLAAVVGAPYIASLYSRGLPGISG